MDGGFFFSSRRRHTRLQGDWSSDVCSSDLASAAGVANGAYVLADAEGDRPDVLLLGTGSEVALCVQAHERLSATGVRSRVVSMPSWEDRKSTRLNSSHLVISYAVFCLKKKKCGALSLCVR